MFNNYMIRVQVVRGGKKHFTTSQHFFQQTRSFCWTGTKFWCFFFCWIFDDFWFFHPHETSRSPHKQKRMHYLLVGTPAWISPILFTAKKTMFFLYFSYWTGCKKQEIPAKFGHLCKAKLELLVPFFPCHCSITPRSMAVGPSWASPKCLANQAWTLKFCCFGWDGKSASFVMLKGLRKIWFDPFTVGIYDIHDIIFACKRQKWSLSSLHI